MAAKTPEKSDKETERRKLNPVDPTKVKHNDMMAFVYYAKVRNVQLNGDILEVEGLAGAPSTFSVRGKELVVSSFSADQYAEEESVTMTRAAEILISSPNRPMTVHFVKQDGEERTLRGRLVTPEPLLGRSYCEDLDIPDAKRRLRLVDHRTIQWLIVDGVKYVVK